MMMPLYQTVRLSPILLNVTLRKNNPQIETYDIVPLVQIVQHQGQLVLALLAC